MASVLIRLRQYVVADGKSALFSSTVHNLAHIPSQNTEYRT